MTSSGAGPSFFLGTTMEPTSNLNKIFHKRIAALNKLFDILRQAVEIDNIELIISIEEEIRKIINKDPFAEPQSLEVSNPS